MSFRDCSAVLIPAHNDAYTLRFCLDALRGEVDDVLVLDDCSVDETSDVVLEAMKENDGLDLIRHEGVQMCWSLSRRRLLSASRARHVFMFDADDVLNGDNPGLLRAIAADSTPYAMFQFCELFGDLRHATRRMAEMRFRGYDRSEVYVDRAWAPELSWADDDQPCNLPAGAYPTRRGGPLTFHLKDVKPDARLVERAIFRQWLAADRATGNSSDFAGLDHMTPDEAHARAIRFLLTSKIDVPVPVWNEDGWPLLCEGDAPPLPELIRNAPQRFRFVYDDAGRIVDRTDSEAGQ